MVACHDLRFNLDPFRLLSFDPLSPSLSVKRSAFLPQLLFFVVLPSRSNPRHVLLPRSTYHRPRCLCLYRRTSPCSYWNFAGELSPIYAILVQTSCRSSRIVFGLHGVGNIADPHSPDTSQFLTHLGHRNSITFALGIRAVDGVELKDTTDNATLHHRL